MHPFRAIALLLALTIAVVTYSRLPGSRESGTFDTDPPTPYFHYTPAGLSKGRVLVVHGLNSGKSVMHVLSASLADSGLEVFAIDLPGHGASRAPFNAIRARNVVESVLERLGPETAVLGHSLGGALLLDIANERQLGRMVLFSPAPSPSQTVLAEHVLVLAGQFDPPRIRAFVPRIQNSTTGSFEFRDLAWTGHSGGLFRARVMASVASWLGGDAGAVRAGSRLMRIALILVLSVALGITLLQGVKAAPDGMKAALPPRVAILYYALAAMGAAGVLAFVNVAGWLRIFALDYLIGFFFVAGSLLRLLCLRWTPFRLPGRRLWIGLAAAAYLIAITGGFGASELFPLALTGGRLWRFPAILALSLPMFLADELLLRPIQPAWKATAVAILTRLVLGAIAVSGVLIFNRESAFLLLVAHLVVLFWIALWLAAGIIRTRTDAVTAACFAALVQAWGFAAVFVTL